MTNENNNINELVSADEDPTAELEVLVLDDRMDTDFDLERDAKTYDPSEELPLHDDQSASIAELRLQLRASNKTISQLQFDIEQLHAKWLGLSAENEARESQTGQLNQELAAGRTTVARKAKLIKKRDQKIKALKSEIRQRENEHRALLIEFGKLEQSLLEKDTGNEPAESTGSVDFQRRLQHSETYADAIRRQLQDLIESSGELECERDYLAQSLLDATQECSNIATTLQASEDRAQELQAQLDTIENRHQEDIRMLRFELGEAQDTMVQTEDLNSQLASDLISARGWKNELEQTLSDSEKQAKSRISRLEKEIKKLKRKADTVEQKLSTKSEAISVLLAELAKRAEPEECITEIDEIEDFVADIGVRKRSNTDRVSRVLVGSIDGQVLRFPLFKDKLTIGRTADNDIQLKAAHISRRHAVLQTDGETTRIIDWGSKNGVFVNAEQIKEHFLNHGDHVTIGNARFRYEELKRRDL